MHCTLVVSTRGKEDAPPGTSPERVATLLTAWKTSQDELEQLSTNHARVVAENAHHMIQYDAPDLVVSAIREVVGSARSNRGVDAHAATAPAR